MASKGKITELFDIEALEKQLKVALESIDTWVEAVEKGSKAKINLKGASKPSEVSAETEKVISQQREQLKIALKVAEDQKAVISLIKQRFSAEAKLTTLQTDYARETTKTRLEIQKLTKEQKAQAAVDIAAPNSLERIRAMRAKIRLEIDKTNLTDTKRIELLNKQVDRLSAIEKKYVDQGRQQALNVGNYQGSAKIIVDALERAREKVVQVGRAFGEASPEAKQARGEFEALSRITENPQFLKISAKIGDASSELAFFRKRLIDMDAAGQQNTDTYKELQKRLAELTDQIGDTKEEIKALSSDSRQFDLFAGAVNFAADAFQTAAGAAVLFGASEEDAAEATRTLIAVQSVSNGIKGIANELTTKGTFANKIFAFSQLQIKTAFDVTATSAARLRAVMVTLGIGALIVGIGLLAANFGKLKNFLFGSSDAARRLAEEQKRLAEFSKDVNESVAKESTQLTVLKAKIEDTKLPMEVRIANVKDLQALYPQYFKDLKQEDILNGNAAAAYDLAAAAILRKAKALAANKKIEELSAQTLDIEKEMADDRKLTDERIKNATKRTKFMGKAEIETVTKTKEEVQAELKDDYEKRQKRREADLAAIKKEQDFYLGTVQQNTDLTDEQRKRKEEEEKKAEEERKKRAKEAADLAKKSGEDRLKSELELEKRKEAALSEIIKENALQRKKIAEDILGDDKAEIQAKIDASKEVQAVDQLLAAQEYEQATKSEIDIENGKRVVREKTQEEKRLALIRFNNKIDDISKNQYKKEVEIIEEGEARKLAAFENSQEHNLSLQEQDLQKIQNFYDNELAKLDERYADGLIKEKDYNNKKLDLQQRLNEDLLIADIKYAKEQLEVARAKALTEPDPVKRQKMLDAIGVAEGSLAALQIKLFNLVTSARIQNNKDQRLSDDELHAKRLAHYEELKSVAEQAFNIISSFSGIAVEKEKNALQEQIDALEAKKQKEIEVANQTITNEQERANAIAVIEARSAAQREQLEIKKRQSQERQARFDKAATIASIIMETALAVIRALGDKATPGIFGRIGGAIAIGAMGAAKLAIAIATPIPQYKHGTGSGTHPGGLAEIGDGGKAEAVILPSGQILKTPSRSVIWDLPKGTKVHPDYSKMMISASLANIPEYHQPAPMKDHGQDIVKELKQVKKAIGKIPQPIIKTEGRYKIMTKQGHSFREYLNRNL